MTVKKYANPHIILFVVVATAWALLMNHNQLWGLFADNWFMSITMVFGSFIAGATSEGGGAIAFPVMTLVFSIEPSVARDFSLMIQSVGMTAASLVIILQRVSVEWRAIFYAGLGGFFGIIFGIEVISGILAPAYIKIFFVSLWLSFGFALYWINRDREREVHSTIIDFNYRTRVILFIIGFLGGIVSGITGSGIDIVIFACLVLLFSLNEKVATRTSVILMAINSVSGFFWKTGFGDGMSADAWNYWYVCIPVVVIGAPLGARFILNRSRYFVVGILYASISLQYIGALFIIPQNQHLIFFNLLVVMGGCTIFWFLTKIGRLRMQKIKNQS